MNIVLYIGFALVCFFYLASSALIFTSKAKGTLRTVFLVTFLGTSAWGAASLFAATMLTRNPFLVWPLLESLFMTTWTLLLLAMLDTSTKNFFCFLKQKYSITVIVAAILFNLAFAFLGLSPELKFKLLVSASLLTAIIQLILLEQIYRAAHNDRWGYRPFILGLASVNIYHLIMMSNALLLNTLDPVYLSARPFIYVLIVPFILLTIKRVDNWNLRIFISRDVVLQSSLLVFAGGYLLLMSLTGYFIQRSGQAWSGVVQIVFVAGALLLLAYIFISESVRKYFRIFIQKHFYANQFDYREQWLGLTMTLDAENSDDDFYEVGLKGLCKSLNYTHGAYYKLTNGQLELKTKDLFSLNQNATNELLHLSTKLAENRWFVDVSDFGAAEYAVEFRGYFINHLIMFDVEIIVPIFINDEFHGVFALSSYGNEKLALNWEVRDYLTTISSQIGSYIRFGEARLKLEENAKFAAFNRMSAFVVHDLKNVIAQIGMIVKNAEKHRDNPEFIDDTFETLGHTKERMDRMLSQLKEKQQTRGSETRFELNAFAAKLRDDFNRNLPQVDMVLPSEPISVFADYDRLYSIVGHLIENAQQATSDDGQVKMTLDQVDNNYILTITDTGVGMTTEFMNNQLFTPFVTTKGNAGMGVGVYEAKSYVEELNGTLTVSSQVGKGSTFKITIPKKED
ncbi:PEP-CTERM system histidine kinase PrsK [Psychrosphaera sp. B3R10]|uniref:XrtA/PEP-CTERM system histidine kinase PrsK n=1 Tax=unclassified Psychrosphaera TaxID=2641570 RepID=UPI001C09CD00|nr:PEP-CTERM system histidine kinase PrsK [Psychrosphaera sp. I2R16]MBU2987956.1 PEP-CTERM system histidine kinase PrsK [Psychrosphaera sp. B3R10]